ncbi:MAG: hypothetical protein AUG51_13250 [Acidobacteria bacterium 13_1_20CM_3_53_8]|nr:MAG: hypothetical protein AUG51_13250 [Acidobacteria bacterium 13_1_20CM_3_53_8]
MNLVLLVPLLITTIVAILSWIVAHRLTAKREIAGKRRELRVKYLIDAYRQLESVGNRELSSKWSEVLESAIADIQLLGTPKQVEMAKRFADDFAKNRAASFDELLFDLRETLRIELQLEPVESNIVFLRISQTQSNNPLFERMRR